ncbi:EKC/KEOPS complex subunit cgi121 [Erysiphe neolycopersici]|uniref:EKC/KEOPS complex subunit CGI121 n=1 Tax=Erysiphe neolycopersici TaxID=212602 RepID=A0A420HCN3_9PEZI|nr:EKC/KEOPS complex subunit cgi121 [Erysiphe neolycopersici]
MMFLKTITLEHTPPSHSVHISLFRNIKNATFLLEQLRSGNVEYEYALLDARVILSSVHLLSACFRAIHCNINNRLRTRNIHSEVVYALSPRNNITTAFVNFGITDQTRDLIIVKVGDLTLHDSIKDHLSKIIEGDAETFSDDTLANITDWTRVHKLYSVMEKRQLQKLRNNGDLNTAEKTEIELLILGAMALKSATN